jgi:N-acetyl-alpha-D-glucosaminyl L-malate synthase BshA
VRIALTCYPTYGGSGVVASELGRQLARRGHEVHFITYDVPFRLRGFQERLYFHEVEVPAYPLFKHPPYLLALANKMVEVAQSARLDILHVHYAIPHATSAYLARQVIEASGNGPAPAVVTTLHGTDITLVGSEPSFAGITAFSIQASDGVTAVSEALKRQTLETFKVSRDIRVIRNFVDPEDYADLSACWRGSLAANGEVIVAHVSNFRPVKRADVVVRVFAAACRDMPARLALIGDGPDLHKVRVEAERLGVSDKLVFLGQQERIGELLAAADVFFLPSLQESFGLAALEAMAAGVPVVATRVGGLPELVGDGDGGFLYEVDDFDGMAQGLRALLTDRDLRACVSARARRRALSRFSSEIIVPQYEAFYRHVLDGVRG